MRDLDVAGYLGRLGLPDPGPPSPEALHALHRAHVERVPYENLDIQLGRPTTVDPYESADRIVRRGRGGYCFHLNGAFATLLAALGYRVRWHVGGVQRLADPAPVGATANHLALTVHGLDDPDDTWLVDAGLGDALHEPLPLRTGAYRQGPFTYRLGPSEVVPGGWRFDHDRTGSFTGMDFGPAEATAADFATRHRWLSTSPLSGFVQVASVYRRDGTGVDALRGTVLSRVDATGRRDTELDSAGRWYAALADVFGLTLTDLTVRDRAALWTRVYEAHLAWLAVR